MKNARTRTPTGAERIWQLWAVETSGPASVLLAYSSSPPNRSDMTLVFSSQA
jgi:hypothetical protein